MRGDRSGTARGLSTAASLLVIFVGLVFAVGSFYTVTANTAERLGEAREDQRTRGAAVATTAINVTSATWDSNDDLVVRITNTGDTTLAVPATDTVVDGTYVPMSAYERVEVDGQSSDLWRPGEQLVIEDRDTVTSFTTAPARVKVVTETGVAATAEVVSP